MHVAMETAMRKDAKVDRTWSEGPSRDPVLEKP